MSMSMSMCISCCHETRHDVVALVSNMHDDVVRHDPSGLWDAGLVRCQ
jgi:hypothetical protein